MILDLPIKNIYMEICVKYIGLYITLKYLSRDICDFVLVNSGNEDLSYIYI